ncbi:hypothetical protein [Klebsiella michiganensis]|uniref:hypothetical protein n=2 Tax=Klebsiella michiganensis TaxID=1134687 RepID=UPI003981D4A4|nr:hypothetical protein [Klebsiella michiganensis]
MPRRGIAAVSTRLALRLAGLRFITVCGPVARVRRLRRNPGNVPRRGIAAVSTRLALRLAGLRFITVCGPVARVRRLRRNPGNVPRRGIAAVSTRLALRLAGLQVHHRLRAGSPGKAFTPQPGECAAT